MATGYLTHPDFQLHLTGEGHPERPERLQAIEAYLRRTGRYAQLTTIEPVPATEAQLLRCHTAAHVERVKSLSETGGGHLDGDTVVSAQSYRVACLASGAAVTAVDAVLEGRVDNAFCAVRPPGHHAESGARPRTPWGFCLFNHVAVAARHALDHHGLKRVAILDFDVHHGNGTQEIFEESSEVLFVSLHEWGIFPNSGSQYERGEGPGLGTTINYPLPAGSDGTVYRRVWEKVAAQVAEFAPELILISAGFDAHEEDGLAHMRLTALDLGYLVLSARQWADSLCGGRLVCVLEGGYDLQGLATAVDLSLQAMLEMPDPEEALAPASPS